jgi:hypothetical protein
LGLGGLVQFVDAQLLQLDHLRIDEGPVGFHQVIRQAKGIVLIAVVYAKRGQ